MDEKRAEKVKGGFNKNTIDVGGLLGKGVDVLKKGIEAYVGWLTPKVESAIDAIAGREPLEDDISRIRQMVEDEKRSGGTVLSEPVEEEVVSDDRPFFGDDETSVMSKPEPVAEARKEKPVAEQKKAKMFDDYERLGDAVYTGKISEEDKALITEYLESHGKKPTGDIKRDYETYGKVLMGL